MLSYKTRIITTQMLFNEHEKLIFALGYEHNVAWRNEADAMRKQLFLKTLKRSNFKTVSK